MTELLNFHRQKSSFPKINNKSVKVHSRCTCYVQHMNPQHRDEASVF